MFFLSAKKYNMMVLMPKSTLFCVALRCACVLLEVLHRNNRGSFYVVSFFSPWHFFYFVHTN